MTIVDASVSGVPMVAVVVVVAPTFETGKSDSIKVPSVRSSKDFPPSQFKAEKLLHVFLVLIMLLNFTTFGKRQ